MSKRIIKLIVKAFHFFAFKMAQLSALQTLKVDLNFINNQNTNDSVYDSILLSIFCSSMNF